MTIMVVRTSLWHGRTDGDEVNDPLTRIGPTRPSPIIARQFESIPTAWKPTTAVAVFGAASRSTTRPSLTVSIGGFFALRAYRAHDIRRMSKWTLCTYSSFLLILTCMALAAIRELARAATEV
jgi:hypothetical protein